VILLACVLETGTGHLDRVAHAVAGLGSEHRGPGALTDHLELGDGVGALEVGGDQQRCVAVVRQPLGELARQGGLTGALEAGEHDHGGRVLGEPHLPGLAAEDLDQFLVDDLDDLLRRVEGLGDLLAAGALLDARDELADHGQRDVRLQQRETDLPRGRVDVLLGQPPLAAQRGEDRCQPVGKRLEHEFGQSFVS